MVASRNFRFRLESILIYLGLGIFAFIAVTPFLHTIARSFSAEAPILRGEVYIWPVGFSLDAYERLIIGGTFWLAYRNSFIITTSATLVQMFMTILCAYPLSRTYLPGRNIFMTLIVFQMIFPPSLIPFYLTVRDVGLIDSWGSLIWPYAINTFNMIVLKSYFQALPKELEESAIIDGANDLAPYNIRVNTIAPGPIETRLPDAAPPRPTEHTLLGRNGLPHENAAAAVFLASDEASFITGERIAVDGGMLVNGYRIYGIERPA